MRTSLIILSVIVVSGVSVLTVESRHFGARTPDAAPSLSSSETASKHVELAQARSPSPGATDSRRAIEARYRAAASISSTVERDKEYAALVGYAAAGGNFELAIEIADQVFAAGERDETYARIVHQAMTVGDIASADKSAEKISSAMLRDEQFKRIAQSCPANTTTEGTPSNLSLNSTGSDSKKSAAPYLLPNLQRLAPR